VPRRELTRDHIRKSAYALFRRKGFLRSGVDEIAAASGITKRTLYAHFESKDQLLAEVMAAQAELSAAAFATIVSSHSRSTRDLIRDLFRDLSKWSSEPRWSGSGFTRLTVELADMPGHPACAIARKHKARLESLLASALVDSGALDGEKIARQIMTLLEGTMVMLLLHRDQDYLHAAAEIADRIALVDGHPAEARTAGK
jgi:AcrR family transcriptional regulator